jgi:hypothetical protein
MFRTRIGLREIPEIINAIAGLVSDHTIAWWATIHYCTQGRKTVTARHQVRRRLQEGLRRGRAARHIAIDQCRERDLTVADGMHP